MSTRSGKRLHNSPAEKLSKVENDEKPDKTRGRRGKGMKTQEIIIDSPRTKKRKNYVSYPSEQDVVAQPPQEPELRQVRALRKNALKEHNPDSGDPPQTLRHTRRTKMIAEDELLPKVMEQNNSEKKVRRKKKKKSSMEVKEKENEVESLQASPPCTKKSKKSKKGKKFSPVADKAQRSKKLNDTNTSVSSYHSAVCSPDHPSEPEPACNTSPETTIIEQVLTSTFDKTTTPKDETKNVINRKLTHDNTFVQESDQVDSGEPTLKNSIRMSNTQYDSEMSETQNVSSGSIKNQSLPAKQDTTYDKNDPSPNTKLDKSSKKSPLAVPDSTVNLTFDKSDISRISITSDDSKFENILNASPVLVESSMESIAESPAKSPKPVATLQRGGTFTKDGPDPIIITSPRPKTTPENGDEAPHLTAGRTPYRSGTKVTRKSVLNRTHSIEKPVMLSAAPARARVVFCSPGTPRTAAPRAPATVIKSSMKGSNKSFVYDEKDCAVAATRASCAAGGRGGGGGGSGGTGRKRARTAEAEAGGAKRSRQAEPQQTSVDRLSRPRTSSAGAKLGDGSPAASGAAGRASGAAARVSGAAGRASGRKGRLPDFAALHARSFERMESLDELVRRRARRAKGLMRPAATASTAADRKSGNLSTAKEPSKADVKPPPAPAAVLAPAPARPERGYSRFGFKVPAKNPFTLPPKTLDKSLGAAAATPAQPPPGPNLFSLPPKAKDAAGATGGPRREASLAGAAGAGGAAARRTAARAAALRGPAPGGRGRREGAREEIRTIIKGVRTNRRFELQMQARNVQA